MHAEILLLRVIHVLGGIFWVGSLFFTSVFLLPALALSGQAGPVMAGLRQRKFLQVIPIIAVLTMLSGFRLLWIASAGSFGAYASSPVGRTFTLGGSFAV